MQSRLNRISLAPTPRRSSLHTVCNTLLSERAILRSPGWPRFRVVCVTKKDESDHVTNFSRADNVAFSSRAAAEAFAATILTVSASPRPGIVLTLFADGSA